MGLARYRGQWCHTDKPFQMAGVVLQGSPYAIGLAIVGFKQKDHKYDRHFYRHFLPSDCELQNIEFFAPIVIWNNYRALTLSVKQIEGRVYAHATITAPYNSVPPPDHGAWDVEQYGGSVYGALAIEHLSMKSITRDECEDYVPVWSANQAL